MTTAVIPSGWTARRLGDPGVARLIMGQSPASSSYNSEGKGLPFYQGKADFGLRYPIPRVWCADPARIAEKGDVLISVRAPVGDVNLATERCCIGRGVASVRAGDSSVDEYLFFALMAHKDELNRLGSGAIFRAINKDTLHTFEFPLPPIQEQRAIALVLAKLQNAIEVEDKRITALRELKAATMAKVFHDGLRNAPLKQTEVGEIPQDWKVYRLGDVCNIKSGGTPSREVPRYWSGGIPWIKTGEINYRAITSASETISEEGLESSAARVFPAGTLLMAMYGQGVTRGKVAFLGIDAATNQACAAFFPDETKLLRRYLFTLFTFYYTRVRDLGHGANQKNLSGEILKGMSIPVPIDTDEQTQISALIGAVQDRIESAECRREVLAALFSSALQQLVHGVLRVTPLLENVALADA